MIDIKIGIFMCFLNAYSNWSQFNPCDKNDQTKKYFRLLKFLFFHATKLRRTMRFILGKFMYLT